MKISETKLRQLIRQRILQEGVVDTAVGTAMIKAAPTVARWFVDYGKEIYRDGKKLAIMTVNGDVVPPKGLLNSAVTDVNSILIDIGGDKAPHAYNVMGKGIVKGQQSIVISMSKKFYKDNEKTLNDLKINPLPFVDIKVTHFGGKITLGGDATKERTEGPAKYIRTYIPAAYAKSSEKIKFTKEELKTGAASIADLGVELGGIIGGIPAVGNVADVVSGILAAVKSPPDYILSALCFLCAAPAIGIGIAVAAKPIARKFSSKGAEKVGKELGAVLADKGVDLTDTTLMKLKKQFSNLIAGFKKEDRVNAIAKAVGLETDEIIKRFDGVEEVANKILDNMEVVGKTSSKGTAEVMQASVKNAAASVVMEITSGQLRNSCIKFAKEIAIDLPKKYPNPKDLIGKKFIHDKTGKEIIFESMNDFGTSYIDACKKLGVPQSEANQMFMNFYQNVVRKPKPADPKDIETITDALLSTIKNMKVKMVVDDKTAKKLFDEGTNGFFDLDTNEVFINVNSFSKKGIEENIRETLQHEIIHGVDKALLTICAGGKEAALELKKKFGYRVASDVMTQTSLKTARGQKLKNYVSSKSQILKIIEDSPENLVGLTNWQYLSIKMGESPGIVAYMSDPAEMFVRAQRISFWLKRNGFKATDFHKFFLRNEDKMVKEVPDAGILASFFETFKRAKAYPNNKLYQDTTKDIVEMLTKFVE